MFAHSSFYQAVLILYLFTIDSIVGHKKKEQHIYMETQNGRINLSKIYLAPFKSTLVYKKLEPSLVTLVRLRLSLFMVHFQQNQCVQKNEDKVLLFKKKPPEKGYE